MRATTAGPEMFMPPLGKKNGVRKAEATTRKFWSCGGCLWNTCATASPSRKAGSTAWLFASSPKISSVLATREPLALALSVPLVGSGLGARFAGRGHLPQGGFPEERRVRCYGDHVEARFGVPPRPLA